MQINPKIIKNQFEKSFDLYNDNAIVQKLMAQKMVKELSKINSNFDSILELGTGTGVLTKELNSHISFNEYYGNDIIQKSKNYISEIIPNAKFYCGNAQRIKPSKSVDLIISNAMFQWFSNLEITLDNYKNFLNKDGIITFSTFSETNFKEIKTLTGLSLDYKSLNEIENIVKKNYKILHSEEFEHTLTFSNPLELLAHMKNTGVNSLTSHHWTFKDVKNFCDKYKSTYPEVTLTYSPIIIICQKI